MSRPRRGILLAAALLALIALGRSRFAPASSERDRDQGEQVSDRPVVRSKAGAVAGGTLQLAPGHLSGVMSGVARGHDGEPLANAVVCAWCAFCNMAFSDNRPHCTRTNDKGEYALKELRAGKYRLVVSADGRGMAVGNGGQTIEVGSDGSVSKLDGDTESPPRGAVVSGLVRDALGGPIPNAWVRMSSLAAPGAAGIDVGIEVQADGDGAFRADVPEGRVRLVAFAEGYATADVSRIAPAEGVELVLAPASTIQGRVVVADGDGRPVAGATVRASTPLGNVQEASSDAQGAFVLTALRPGTYQLRAFAPGWIGEPSDAVSLDLSDHVTDVVIPMHLGVRVEATLLAGDEPCTSGVVAVGPPSPGDVSVPREVTAPDVTGRLVFPALPPGRYSVELNCEGYGTEFAAPLVLGTADQLGLVWKMSARAELTIRAVDTRGQAVKRLQLSVRPSGQNPAQGPDAAHSRTGQTDADGRLTFKGMGDGQFIIEGRHVDEPVLIELRAGEIRQAEVVASILGSIQVKVVTPSGVPVQQVTVSADRSDGPGGFGRAIGDGVFEVAPLDPGSYSVSARDSINPRVVQPDPVVVLPGEETQVTMVYGGYDGEISGRVLSGPDVPLADVWVSAVAVGQQDDPYAASQQFIASLEGTRAFSAPDGQFRLTGLAREGRYYVIAERPSGGQAKLDNVQVGQRVELVIEEPQ